MAIKMKVSNFQNGRWVIFKKNWIDLMAIKINGDQING